MPVDSVMLVLTTLIELALLTGILSGAGLVLARWSLLDPIAGSGRVIDRIQRCGLVLAAGSAAAAFAVLVWRLGGEFDLAIAIIAAQSPPGYATGLVIAGSILALTWRSGSTLGAMLVVAGTAIVGHAAAISVASGIVVGVHVAAAAWWTGGLMLLLVATRQAESLALWDLLARFSAQAAIVIALLLAAGGWTLIQLVGFTLSSLTTPYGLLLLLKLALVAGALSIAAFNRWKLTPAIALDAQTHVPRLRKNIAAELSIIALVVVVTVMLTTTGPQVVPTHHH